MVKKSIKTVKVVIPTVDEVMEKIEIRNNVAYAQINGKAEVFSKVFTIGEARDRVATFI